MKLRRVLYWIFISYICINTIYTSIPLIMAFTRIPTTVPFYSPVIGSLINYHLIKMTYLHMLFDLILIIVGIRKCIKQNSSTHFLIFTLIVVSMNFFSNLIWTFVGYFYLVQ